MNSSAAIEGSSWKRRCPQTAFCVLSILVGTVFRAFSADRFDNTFSSTEQLSSHSSHTNRLIREKSPYLLQHAHNPVDWYPWGEEAFARARELNKPIFLSVGYSTCHWCHVMERESFENLDIARILNDAFVCIKVDREERPDIDQVYMTFVQATTGGGGWPMSVWLTPALKPFLGGTYFPPDKFKQLLIRVSEAWRDDHDKILASGEALTRKLEKYVAGGAPKNVGLDASWLDDCYAHLKSSYEPRYGGFGDAPKFPRPAGLIFLLRYYDRTGKRNALDMVLHTLRKMADGGIYDHLGGGFHRYSTDLRWHVPHFEKMLYDQAQLVCVYLEAFQITHEAFFSDIARNILRYVQRDLTGDQGQFFSAEDADSPVPGNSGTTAEAAFYTWQRVEIDNALGTEPAAMFKYYYGVEAKGNVEADSNADLKGQNVLIVSHSLEETAKRFNLSPEQVGRSLEASRQIMVERRARRPRPRLDDKAVTAWNGLMLSAFARAAQVLDDPTFLTPATRAQSFLKANCYDAVKNKLFRRFRSGEAAVDGCAEDYAFLIQGLLDLYEASFDINDLKWAIELQTSQNRLFEDQIQGGYFTTAAGDTNLLLRMKEDYDGAEPSANSVTALNLLRLAQMTDAREFGRSAESTLKAFANRLRDESSAMPQMLLAIAFRFGKPKQIVIAGKPDSQDTKLLLQTVHQVYLPAKILLLADGAEGQRFLATGLEFLDDLQPLGGKATAFVCVNYTCQMPTTDPAMLRKQLTQPTR
jgi:uncharacterized protein YyaL (SSP411 family)